MQKKKRLDVSIDSDLLLSTSLILVAIIVAMGMLFIATEFWGLRNVLIFISIFLITFIFIYLFLYHREYGLWREVEE